MRASTLVSLADCGILIRIAYRATDPAAPATDGYQLNLPASAGLLPGFPFGLWMACLR